LRSATFTKILFSLLFLLCALPTKAQSQLSTSDIPWPYIDVTAYPYFAKCDGVTDDSVALQAAGNAAIATGNTMQLPEGSTSSGNARVCLFGTTLNFTKNSLATLYPSISIRGGGNNGIATILKYTGTGDALVISSGVTDQYIYNVDLENFQLWGAASAPAGRAIVCQYCDQVNIRNVQIFGLQNYVAQVWGFTVGFDLSNNGGTVVSDSTWTDTNVGMKLVNAVNVIVKGGGAGGNNIDFLMGGSNTDVIIRDGWDYERQNFFMDWDDSLVPGSFVAAYNIEVLNNYMLLGGSTWANTALKVNNLSTNIFEGQNVVFEGNNIYCSNECTASTQPFNLSFSSTTYPGSNLSLTIEKNWIWGWPNGIGAVTANDPKIQVSLINNQDLQTDFDPQLSDAQGTGSYIFSRYLWWNPNTGATGVLLQGPMTMSTPYKVITSSYTLTQFDSWINVNCSGSCTVTIPHAMVGERWDVQNTTGNTVILVCDSGQINNESNVTFTNVNMGFSVTADGTNCWAH
jgi:hypothetical protein